MAGNDSKGKQDTRSDRVKKQIEVCLNMKPSEGDNNYDSLRSKLSVINTDSEDSRKPLRSADGPDSDVKKLERSLSRFANSLTGLNKNSETLIECICFVLNKLEKVECDLSSLINRVSVLEAQSSTISPSNDVVSNSLVDRISALEATAHIVASSSTDVHTASSYADVISQSDRLEKLEFDSSEKEREERLLHATMTHPSIDNQRTDLHAHVREFMLNHLRMTEREIDANMQVTKLRRSNSVLLIFSHARFKTFLYAARKKMRTDDPDSCDSLYINDYLTLFNISILNSLKSERRNRNEAGLASFSSVFTFRGRVYVKLTKDSERKAIKDKKTCKEFIESLSVSGH